MRDNDVWRGHGSTNARARQRQITDPVIIRVCVSCCWRGGCPASQSRHSRHPPLVHGPASSPCWQNETKRGAPETTPRQHDTPTEQWGVKGNCGSAPLSAAAAACPRSCPTDLHSLLPRACCQAVPQPAPWQCRGWRGTASAPTQTNRRARGPCPGWRARWQGARRSCTTHATRFG